MFEQLSLFETATPDEPDVPAPDEPTPDDGGDDTGL